MARRDRQLQRGGALPRQLPVHRSTAVDYIWGYALWPALLIIAIGCFFQSRGRDAAAGGEVRSA